MSESGLPTKPWHVRFARPTAHLAETADMYARGLGLERMSSFEDHDGFDGVMLGDRRAGWHLELTTRRGHAPEPPPSPEHHLVLYVAEDAEFARVRARMLDVGFRLVDAVNPYWDREGCTLEDHDGHRVVLQRGAWRPST